jgi:hypothetical protein
MRPVVRLDVLSLGEEHLDAGEETPASRGHEGGAYRPATVPCVAIHSLGWDAGSAKRSHAVGADPVVVVTEPGRACM